MLPRPRRCAAAVDDLLARLVLTGYFTQADIARTICAAGGDYRMAVKGNQPLLHDDLTLLCADPDAASAGAQETRLHGGRIERRVLRASTELTGSVAWPGRAHALCVARRVTHKARGQTRTDVASAITALTPSAATLAPLVTVRTLWREHGGIADKLPWI